MDEHGLVSVVVYLFVADYDGVGIVALAFFHGCLLLGQAGEPAGVVAFLYIAFFDLIDNGLELLVDLDGTCLSQAQLQKPILQLGQQIHYLLLEVVCLPCIKRLQAFRVEILFRRVI